MTAGAETASEVGSGPSWAQPIQRENLADVAFRAIRKALMEGHLRPGEPLHLRPLSSRFRISVTPMREALLRLVSANALAMDDRGTVIVPALSQSQVREIWEIRAELEAKSAGIAAGLVTADELAELRALNGQIVADVERRDFAAAVRANTRFHLRLAALSRRPILAEMIETLWIRTGPLLWHAYDRQAPRWTPNNHLAILSALAAGDAEAASETLRGEVLNGMAGFMKFAEPDPPPDR
ncbi:MAG: GntR family transcriptional regulator [Pseudooceanicola sp.]